jgi:hypothetical protein
LPINYLLDVVTRTIQNTVKQHSNAEIGFEASHFHYLKQKSFAFTHGSKIDYEIICRFFISTKLHKTQLKENPKKVTKKSRCKRSDA